MAKKLRKNKMEEEDEGTSSDQLVDTYLMIMMIVFNVIVALRKVWMIF